MGGVIRNIVEDVNDVIGDAIGGGGGGGGSAAPAPRPAPAPKTSPASPGGLFKDAASVTQPTFDQISPIRPFEPGEGGFFGGVGPIEAKTGFDPTQPFTGEYTTGFPAGGGSAAPSGQRGQFEAATQFGLNQPAGGMQMSQTPFQRPETMARQMVEGNPFQTGGQAPLTPEQAQVFARQAAQRFAAGGPVQQGVGSLMGRMRRN